MVFKSVSKLTSKILDTNILDYKLVSIMFGLNSKYVGREGSGFVRIKENV